MKKKIIADALNSIRFISADAVQKANSGHPGMPMGAAAMGYTLFVRAMKHNPKNPEWIDRDRFILSGGHGSMLLYSLLYLTGYGLTREDLAQFRQWGSKTPGHPEWKHTVGVETTTGPLGQGFANGVGMAIAERQLAAKFNRPGFDIVNHYTYAIVTDGDLMEGIASEAASMAGHLQLGKLIYLYDSNRITIEGSTDLTFSEDVAKRFESYGWQVLDVDDGNDVDDIEAKIEQARKDPRPSLIICHTTIGFGLPTKAGSASVHGSPVGWEELNKAKELAGWPQEPLFYVSEAVEEHYNQTIRKGTEQEAKWNELFSKYSEKYPELAKEFKRRMAGELPAKWDKQMPFFPADIKGMATRAASGKVINAIAPVVTELIGGSADLAPSNNTFITGSESFSSRTPLGRNMHFGIRELGMAAITNGIAVHGGLIPYCATFLVFSDYLRGALRVSALSGMHSIYVFTHDSIAVGEDGPTHEPVETLMSLRLIPNLIVIRPSDANETTQAWKFAISHQEGPTALILSRQNLPVIDRKIYSSADGVQKGAYVLYESKNKHVDLMMMASGSEVYLILEAAKVLEKRGYGVRLISFPSWELFEKQSKKYKDSVLLPWITKRLAVEAGVNIGWQKYVKDSGAIIGLDRFGASAPGAIMMKEFGFNVENVVKQAVKLIKSPHSEEKNE